MNEVCITQKHSYVQVSVFFKYLSGIPRCEPPGPNPLADMNPSVQIR